MEKGEGRGREGRGREEGGRGGEGDGRGKEEKGRGEEGEGRGRVLAPNSETTRRLCVWGSLWTPMHSPRVTHKIFAVLVE